MNATAFRELLQVLTRGGVEFIVVGGVAAFAHGAARVTLDLDVVYRRTPENIRRVASVLAPLQPYPRGAPRGLPFRWDDRAVSFGTNFTLETSLGLIDLPGEITGGGKYEDLLPATIRLEIYGISCLCLDLTKLIEVKRAAGRPKAFEAIAELDVIAEERRRLD